MSPTQRNSKKTGRRTAHFETVFLLISIPVILMWGWWNRNKYINAETGLGYYLGIAGGLAMLLLLFYPLRKRIPGLRGVGAVSFWFRLHMALGIIGPVLILYHANFGLGSLNSNVALWAMLIVAGSGIFGRFFYTKIHRGLYGKKIELRELMVEAETLRAEWQKDLKSQTLLDHLDQLEKHAFVEATGIFDAAAKAVLITAKARKLHSKLKQNFKRGMKKARQDRDKAAMAKYRSYLGFSKKYFQHIEQAAELGFYERLFAAWHILHLPLFFLLVVSAVVHVTAVHLY
ncbi:MAG: pyridine nucleotide-disulfide oxidoreductase [bacterium]